MRTALDAVVNLGSVAFRVKIYTAIFNLCGGYVELRLLTAVQKEDFDFTEKFHNRFFFRLVYVDNDRNAGQFRMHINKILGKSSLKMKDVATVVDCIGCLNN